MKALTCAEHSCIYFPNLSSWKPSSPTLQHQRMCKVQAEAKGFSRAPMNIHKEKSKRIETVPRKTSGGDGNGDDDDDKIPEVVFERIIVRILFYVGVPLSTGLAFLQLFNVVKEQHLWDVPLWLPFLTTFLTFGASALGIAYGTLSTSWDPEKKGSLLGFEEAQKNWVDIWKEEEDS